MTIEKTDEEFINLFVKIGKHWNLTNLQAKILGYVFLQLEPLSMEELTKKTGYSLASISNNVRFLERIGIIEKTSKPGTKKIFLKIERDVYKRIRKIVENAYEYKVKLFKETLPVIIECYKKELQREKNPSKKKILNERISIVQKLSKDVMVIESLTSVILKIKRLGK
ncbi:hypothetical protein KAW38_05350 [Candidatus Micrarchaeota archaeon]|nr:hypothetical protein [Candidatus Micrarchaeota archaeon]